MGVAVMIMRLTGSTIMLLVVSVLLMILTILCEGPLATLSAFAYVTVGSLGVWRLIEEVL